MPGYVLRCIRSAVVFKFPLSPAIYGFMEEGSSVVASGEYNSTGEMKQGIRGVWDRRLGLIDGD